MNETKNSGKALTSLTFGIISLIGGAFLIIPSIVAIIFGHMSFKDFRNPQVVGKGMAITGLVMGYLSLVGAIIAFIIISAIGVVGAGVASVANEISDSYEESIAIPDTNLSVGEIAITDKFEINVTQIVTSQDLSSDYQDVIPAEGGIYLCVVWNYKNISKQPISTWSTPSITLLSPDGAEYSTDVGASSSFATKVNINAKIISDLNPNIKVEDADVFEISKELLEQGGWKLIIDADKKVAYSVN